MDLTPNTCSRDNGDGGVVRGGRPPSGRVPSVTYLLVEEAVENSHQQALEGVSGQGQHSGCQGRGTVGTHLEGTEEQVEKELGGAQGALGMLIGHEGKDHLMDPQQGDEGQCGPGQPAGAELENTPLPGLPHPHPPPARTQALALAHRNLESA